MLPTAAFDLLQFDLVGAARLVEKGDVKGGYQMLLDGLQRARETSPRGASWVEALIEHYQQALINYAERYGRPKGEEESE